ncbi:hypothetical protein [Streptomyces sp. BH105]|uniref:hypothetical protein n=1 Tax=Streptomyces sp. BH105 TaxID=3410408 RepID=UPI003CF49BE6
MARTEHSAATPATIKTRAPVGRSSGTGRDPLLLLSLAAGIGFTATAEYELARTIGASVPVAVLLPLALDVYVVAAIRRSRGRDIALALILMGTAQVAAHMLEAGVVAVSVPLVAAVSLLVPLSIWRVHALAIHTTPRAEVATLPATEGVSRPELKAVPVPAKPSPRTPRSPRAKADTFESHVRAASVWLEEDPALTGTAVGKRLGTGDSYGRRVLRAARAVPEPGPVLPAVRTGIGRGGEGYN